MNSNEFKSIAIIGGGPSGLMAAEYLSARNFRVTVYDRKNSLGRKFLLAGRGGLNLTHSESMPVFLSRYGQSEAIISKWLTQFTPDDLRRWTSGLGEETFIGSSGRIFPKSFKASPLLRAWLRRLDKQGVEFKLGRHWQGGTTFRLDDGTEESIQPHAVLLALGGASWPHLGADGAWMDILGKIVDTAPLRAANCGFTVPWSQVFKEKFSGVPLKSIGMKVGQHSLVGEVMIDHNGIEGSGIYALSRFIREEIEISGNCQIRIDLRPTLTKDQIIGKLSAPRGTKSFSSYLHSALGLSSIETNLLYEHDRKCGNLSNNDLAHLIKNLAINLTATFPLARAISTAGGIKLDQINDDLMLKNHAGWFVAGEMLDWEAPTGGYLLQACLSSGIAAAKGIENYLSRD